METFKDMFEKVFDCMFSHVLGRPCMKCVADESILYDCGNGLYFNLDDEKVQCNQRDALATQFFPKKSYANYIDSSIVFEHLFLSLEQEEFDVKGFGSISQQALFNIACQYSGYREGTDFRQDLKDKLDKEW